MPVNYDAMVWRVAVALVAMTLVSGLLALLVATLIGPRPGDDDGTDDDGDDDGGESATPVGEWAALPPAMAVRPSGTHGGAALRNETPPVGMHVVRMADAGVRPVVHGAGRTAPPRDPVIGVDQVSRAHRVAAFRRVG